jgi:hypothetical protein
MASYTHTEVQEALNYLTTGGPGGGPLTEDQMIWECNPWQNGLSFGERLYLAAKNPGLFPDVLTAPFMTRKVFQRPNIINGNPQPLGQVSSWDAEGAPDCFSFYPSYLFQNAVLIP